MVQTTVRPVLTVLRTVRMTIAAARASRPDQATSDNKTRGECCMDIWFYHYHIMPLVL